ncbi:helix-turn-helix transcriptional regulator [Bacillus velezensis]|uniref:helix-turn-helix transcriptional regulator n=1 Tax=Bacillus velezensis TaxID=492670 RepID=UPI0013CFDF15|nr:helix-turn-helix transcriptional regulator [Bacillus velezensis]
MSPRTWLTNYRNKAELTQEVVALRAEIKRPYYTQIESGTRQPSVNVAKRIGDILDFDWTLFFNTECSESEQKSNTA